jgi:hypothetical protein
MLLTSSEIIKLNLEGNKVTSDNLNELIAPFGIKDEDIDWKKWGLKFYEKFERSHQQTSTSIFSQ